MVLGLRTDGTSCGLMCCMSRYENRRSMTLNTKSNYKHLKLSSAIFKFQGNTAQNFVRDQYQKLV